MNNLNVILMSALIWAVMFQPAWAAAIGGGLIGLVVCIAFDLGAYAIRKRERS
ncbi:hypothetical protein V3589_02505 [Sinorhizobium fredii]|uniref:hypothetical protein n=1 Tax=Rhizobium fredii TaxID=380 RepID=UPI0030B5D7B1